MELYLSVWSWWRRDLNWSMVWGVKVMLMSGRIWVGFCCCWLGVWTSDGWLVGWDCSIGRGNWNCLGGGVGSGGFQAGSGVVITCVFLGTCLWTALQNFLFLVHGL